MNKEREAIVGLVEMKIYMISQCQYDELIAEI